MSVDHYYVKIDGRWVRANMRVVNGKWEYIPYDELPDFHTDFWVDVSWAVPAIDERYYFPDLASALDFYTEGWKEREYLDENGKGTGIDHSELCSCGRLIHRQTILDTTGHEGENLRQICKEIAEKLDQEETA